MIRSLKTALAAIALCASFNAAYAQAPSISDGVVRVGVLTDMTGVFSDLAGPGAVTAAQMAIDDFVASKKPASIPAAWI